MQFKFPDSFLFGAATSAFQIEGQQSDDSSGPSIWSSYLDQNTVDQKVSSACLHYKHWKDDISLINALNLDAYRFSVSWARVLPEGLDPVNQEGLGFYDRLVDTLLDNGITPMLTLYHWDLPQALQEQGGWAHPESPDWFCEYTNILGECLADRVPYWITLNEPWVFMHLGMITGEHAPGIQSVEYAAKAYKNILLSHSRALGVLRYHNSDINIGVASNISAFTAATDSKQDIQACERIDAYHNRIFLDPWVNKTIPEITDLVFGKYNPKWTNSELNELKPDIDFLGINYYTSKQVAYNQDGFLDAGELPPQKSVTDMNWEIKPEGLLEVLKWAHQTYKLPLFVTENGAAFTDSLHNAQVLDEERTEFIKNHIHQCKKALNQNIPLKGYFVWSLLDNYEWNYGLSKRFGLIHVDFNTQKRTIKKSGHFYRELIEMHKQKRKLQPDQTEADVDDTNNIKTNNCEDSTRRRGNFTNHLPGTPFSKQLLTY